MLVKLKNVGDAPRVLYEKSGRKVVVPVGKETTADVHPLLAEKLRNAQDRGDTMTIAVIEEEPAAGETAPRQRSRQRARPAQVAGTVTPPVTKVAGEEPKAPTKPPKPADVLGQVDTLDYHTLLAMVKQIAPDNKLPPRPTKQQMLEVLRGASVHAEEK